MGAPLEPDPGTKFLGDNAVVVLFQAVRVVLVTESNVLPTNDFSGFFFDRWFEKPGNGLFCAELAGLLLLKGLSLLKNPSSAWAACVSANNRAAVAEK